MIDDRERRLRVRIDQLVDERDAALTERDQAIAELRAMKANIRAAKIAAARLGRDDGTYAWLDEWDRRRAVRIAKRREKAAV